MKRNYMTQLSKWARWMLPRQEAEDVIADYRDITGISPRSKEELIRDLGKPWSVVKAAAQPKQYHIWLVVFSILAVCVIFPIIMSYNEFYWNPIITPAYMLFLCLGVGLSLRNFRQNSERQGKLPKSIVLLLVILLIGIAGVWFLAGLVLTESWELLNWLAPTIGRAEFIHLLLRLGIFVMAAAALCGLVNARVDECRWCAVYILGLCGVILGLSLHLLLRRMDLEGGLGWQTSLWIRYSFITILGLIGTGVALC